MAEKEKPANSGNDTALNKATETEEFEIVETPPSEGNEPKDDPDDDNDGDEGDEGDARLSAEAEAEEERERPRRDRRSERQRRKERIKEAFERERAEKEEFRQFAIALKQEVEQLKAQVSNTRVDGIQQQMARAEQAYRAAEARIAEAVRLGDGEAHIAALRQRDNASAEWHKLNAQKTQAAPPVQEQVRDVASQMTQPVAPKVTERGREFAQDFLAQHRWIDPNGRDEDNRTVQKIDAELVEDGFNPNTKAYWSEFSERLRDELPHKFRNASQRRAPPVGSGREHVPNSTRQQVYVSPERKAAMQQVGAWDDPEKRKRMLSRYAEYDRNQGSR